MELLTSSDKGDFAETMAIAYFTRLGYVVFRAVVRTHLDFDLVLYCDRKFETVQVKYTSNKGTSPGSYIVGLRLRGSNAQGHKTIKTGDEIIYDRLFAITKNGRMFDIPKTIIETIRTGLQIGDGKYSEYEVFLNGQT
jgi:hypothetical protein